MLASRIYRFCRLTWIGFILVMLFVSYTYCVSEASASPVGSAVHDPLEGSYIIRESTFILDKHNSAEVEGVDLILDVAGEIVSLKAKLASDGAWYACDVFHSKGQIQAHCDTTKGMRLLVAEMDELQLSASR
jgi:hypothetical protein